MLHRRSKKRKPFEIKKVIHNPHYYTDPQRIEEFLGRWDEVDRGIGLESVGVKNDKER